MLSNSFVLSGTSPKKRIEVKRDSKMTYERPSYPKPAYKTLQMGRQSPGGLFINEFIDYEDGSYLTTSPRHRSKDLQPRIILQSPMLTSTPRDASGQSSGRGHFNPPRDTFSGRGHFDQLSDTLRPPPSYRNRNYAAKIEGREQGLKVNRTMPRNENSYISRIQSRPLPSPVQSDTQKDDHIYLSPIKIKQKQADTRTNFKEYPDRLLQTNLNNSPPKKSPPAPYPSRNECKAPEVRSTGLGKRAVTEMDFTRAYVSGQLVGGERVSRAKDPVTKDPGHPPAESGDSLVRKGLVWVQQDKLFSRWKERYIILTTSYIQIFKKGTSRISDMGTFDSKVRLSQVETISLEDKRGYLTLLLTTQRDGKILLRKPEGIKDWHNSIVHHSHLEKQTTRMKTTEQFWKTKQVTDSQDIQDWLLARDRVSTVMQSSKLSKESPRSHRRQDKFKLSHDNSSTSYFLPSSRKDMFGREDSGFESLATTSLESGAASFKQGFDC